MSAKAKLFVATVFMCQIGLAQVAEPTILQIELANVVQYVGDISDVTRFATDPNLTTASPRNFQARVTIADIVAVNGQPAMGTATFNTRVMNLRTAPNPGEAIADTTRNGMDNQSFEILRADGTPIGTIMALGLGGGSAVPGSPLEVTQGPGAIAGGTGAFLGVRGQTGTRTGIPGGTGPRQASMAEDPANRRRTPGGRIRYVLTVIPTYVPQIVATPSGSAVFHADFSPVTSANPAKANEVLITRATGLGPTRPGVDPGQPFPLDTAQEVNSPLAVSVNGQPAEVINAIGWPGQVNTYRVDFRMPAGIAAGTAAIQLTAAWMAGPSVSVPVQ
jgi:hypothetical protein